MHQHHSFLSTSFQRENMMGPNALLLVEELCQRISLEPGMRVLDLGCGCGLTSLYLAHRYDVQVVAMDLWVSATDNARRCDALGFGSRITPLHLDVMDLPRLKPFAEDYFDAVISADAYHYFGSDVHFFDDYLAPFIKPGGTVGFVIPGLKQEFSAGVPPELQPYWQDDMYFYTPSWWHRLWQQSRHLQVEHCGEIDCCQQAWDEWLLCDNPYALRDRGMMAAEAGRYFNFTKMTGHVAK